MINTVIVTGGAGFIGSAVIRLLLSETNTRVINVDKLTYAGNQATISAFAENSRYCFEQLDICDKVAIRDVFQRYQPDAIMHLAAESHVDRSIDGPWEFIQTNVIGTYTLLEVVREYLQQTDNDALTKHFRFHHVSTDEVFGSLGDDGLFTEESSYQPNSPYSATKASSDHLVRAWCETFNVPVVLSNCSNNYGPFQYPEKLLPVVIAKALALQPIPVYGNGKNIRDWLYVNDHARALLTIMTEGEIGRSYNVGGNAEKTNLEVVHQVCQVLDEIAPAESNQPYQSLIEYVVDRPGHDFRYAIDATRIHNELGWQPTESFSSGIHKTVQWYLDNQDWIQQVQTENKQAGARLGAAHLLDTATGN